MKLNLKAISDVISAIGEYLFSSKKIKNKFNKINNVESLQLFIQERSAFVTQTTLYGYLKTRMGLKFTIMFSDEIFLQSVNKSKWNIYGEAVADMTFFSVSFLYNEKQIKNIDVLNLYYEILNKEKLNGMPVEIMDKCKLNFKTKLKNFQIKDYINQEEPFKNSCLSLYKWAPIAEELKTLDKEIVLNSMKNKWNLVLRDFKSSLTNFT